MFKDLIERIKETVKLNSNAVEDGDIERSYYASGMVRGYANIIESMGHEVWLGTKSYWDCDQIWILRIDDTDIVLDGMLLNE